MNLSSSLNGSPVAASSASPLRRREPTTWARLRELLCEERGAVMTEYVAVTGFVSLVTIPSLLYCGLQLATSFGFVRDYALYPFP